MNIKSAAALGKLIKEIRKKQGLTQTDLAFSCGVGVRFIVDLEKGKETCQIGKTIKVVNMLGIELSALEPKVTEAE